MHNVNRSSKESFATGILYYYYYYCYYSESVMIALLLYISCSDSQVQK